MNTVTIIAVTFISLLVFLALAALIISVVVHIAKKSNNMSKRSKKYICPKCGAENTGGLCTRCGFKYM